MSLEMEAINNKWQARMELIQHRQLYDPNYEPQSRDFDPVILEDNFFERYPYMRHYVNKPGTNKNEHSAALSSTSVATALTKHFFACCFGFFAIVFALICFGLDLATASDIAAFGCLLYGVVRLGFWACWG